jgi:ribosomal protein S12 methylthiotransferase
VIRTTFIVGYPQETEEKFLELKRFISERNFDKLGVFTYSQEEGTPAFYLQNTVDEELGKH